MPVVGSVFGKPLDDDIYGLQNALAIIVSGDTAPSALSKGKYIYLINHSTIRSGLYRIISAIASGDTIVSTDIEVPTDGIINDLIEVDGAKVNKTDIVDDLTTNDSTKVLSAAQGYALNSNITGEYESLNTHVFIYRQGKQRTIIFKYAPNSEISGITLATKDRPTFWQWCFGLSTDISNHYPVMAFVQLSTDGGLIFHVFTGGYNADSGDTAPGASRVFHGALTYYVE